MRTRKLASALFGSVLLGASLAPGLAHAQEVVLKFAHFMPPTNPYHVHVIVPWCERIAARSAGRMKCQIYPANQLGGTAPQLLNQVRDGVADIIWTMPGYNSGRFPITEVFELPFFTTTPEATARALWDFTQQHAMREFAGMKPLATWTPGAYAFHMSRKEVKTLEDLKGQKVRTPSRLGNKLLAALGATPVGMPAPQMSEGIAKGVIDGALYPWESVPSAKLHELSRFSFDANAAYRMSAATTLIAMNQKKYDSLPADLRKIIDDNSGREFSAQAAAALDREARVGRDATIANGNAVYVLPAAEVARWQSATQPIADEWIEEMNAAGHDGRKLHAAATALVKQYTH